MNLLILSPGRRVEIVEFFKETFHKENRNVYTLDMSPYAPALYSGDEYFCINKDFNNLEKYIDDIISICNTYNITSILTLIDPELVLLAKNEKKFQENGIKLILSDLTFINKTFDKYDFYQVYKDSICLVETVGSYTEAMDKIHKKEWKYPLFAKLRNGSASIGIKKINTIEDINSIKNNTDYIYQPFIDGIELGVDAYFDMISGELVSIFMKRKIAMRAGETDKAISCKSIKVLNEIKKLAKIKGLRGPIDIDVFIDKNENVYINEVNPRFGGGHPHAYGCGINFMKLILNNLNNKANEPLFFDYKENILMLKYNGLLFKDLNE